MSQNEEKYSEYYAPRDMPALSELLDRWAKSGLTCKIRIRSGTPRHWFSSRYLRHVHANLAMKRGIVKTSSKSLTDAVTAMPVARWVQDAAHGSMDVFVFSEYGRRKHRPEKERSEEQPGNTVHGCCIGIPDGIGDELPFN